MEKLRQILRERGLQEMNLAASAGLSPYRLSRLLNNRSGIRPIERRRIANALGITMEKIFGRRKRRGNKKNGRVQTKEVGDGSLC